MKNLTMKQTREALALLSIVDMMHVEGLAAGTINENAARIAYKAQGGRPVRYIHISSRARKSNLDAIAAAVAEAIGEERWAEIIAVVTGEETEAAQQPQEAAQEAPAAEAEQQPTETENAPQAATQAAEGTAQQADDITAAILGAIGAQAPAHTVTVTWANGTRGTYSAAMLDLLRTDPAALDIQDDDTGELVYIKPDAMEAEQTTTNKQKEEERPMSNTANELQKYVDGIAADLRKLYEADPTDEEREAAEENGDACDLYSYFSDVLDIEYTISSRGDYLGARIAVAFGGPNIYIDTREGYVKGYWGTDRAERWIPSEICEEIDSIMEEYYDMVRGA